MSVIKPLPGETVREFVERGGSFSAQLPDGGLDGLMPDEDITTPEHLLHAGRGRQLLAALPGAAKLLTEFAVDNPGQCAVMMAGTVVATRLIVRAVRPSTPLEALATIVVANVAIPYVLTELVRRDVVSFRVRGPDGSYVQLRDMLARDSGADRLHPAG